MISLPFKIQVQLYIYVKTRLSILCKHQIRFFVFAVDSTSNIYYLSITIIILENILYIRRISLAIKHVKFDFRKMNEYRHV